MSACGLDFGTSNSGVSRPVDGSVRLLELEDGLTSLPSAVFFAAEAPHEITFGRAGTREYLDGTPGRLMRSLKSLLGNSLIYETTAIGDRDVRFVDVVTLYLRTLRLRACENAEASLESVVMGRPVRFVDDDPNGTARPRRRSRPVPFGGLSPRRIPARADRGCLRL